MHLISEKSRNWYHSDFGSRLTLLACTFEAFFIEDFSCRIGLVLISITGLSIEDVFPRTFETFLTPTRYSLPTPTQSHLYGFFFNWYPPKKLKYGKPKLCVSTLT